MWRVAIATVQELDTYSLSPSLSHRHPTSDAANLFHQLWWMPFQFQFSYVFHEFMLCENNLFSLSLDVSDLLNFANSIAFALHEDRSTYWRWRKKKFESFGWQFQWVGAKSLRKHVAMCVHRCCDNVHII